METVYSGMYQYKLSPAHAKVPAGRCILDIIRYDNGTFCVMMTESKENKGVSVTGACDRIAAQVHNDFLKDTPADKIVWLEHTPASRMHKARIDLIQFQSEPGGAQPPVFSYPRWQRFFESAVIVQQEFLKTYAYVLEELSNAHMIFELDDRGGHSWRVWAGQNGFFVMSTNSSAELPGRILDVAGVHGVLGKNARLFASGANIEERFTTALMKGFLNKGL